MPLSSSVTCGTQALCPLPAKAWLSPTSSTVTTLVVVHKKDAAARDLHRARSDLMLAHWLR
ncbi:MAG: hypothetical protein U5L74_10135 [Ideonella sp.]|nr:hypothetical protein [Ideonella sp.]